MEGMRDVNVESLYEVRLSHHPVSHTRAYINFLEQYGSRVGIWRILRLFAEFKVKITSWAVGQALEMNPAVAAALEDGGHEIASHGYRWIDRSSWTIEEEKENVRKAIKGDRRTTVPYRLLE
jgi:peptidoglycan/xylan/chitin deacetylase (PgdA/CDA1 family)